MYKRQTSRTFTLGGIDPKAEYRVETYDGAAATVAGGDLARWAVSLEPRAFRLVFYESR